jgi:hypothetical protein
MYSQNPSTQVPSTAESPQHNVAPSANPVALQLGISNSQSKLPEPSSTLSASPEATNARKTMKCIEMSCIKAESERLEDFDVFNELLFTRGVRRLFKYKINTHYDCNFPVISGAWMSVDSVFPGQSRTQNHVTVLLRILPKLLHVCKVRVLRNELGLWLR